MNLKRSNRPSRLKRDGEYNFLFAQIKTMHGFDFKLKLNLKQYAWSFALVDHTLGDLLHQSCMYHIIKSRLTNIC